MDMFMSVAYFVLLYSFLCISPVCLLKETPFLLSPFLFVLSPFSFSFRYQNQTIYYLTYNSIGKLKHKINPLPMILLNSESLIIKETLKLSSTTPVSRLDKIDISFEDHSGGHFHLYAEGKKEIKLSAKLPAWKEISKDKALLNLIKKEYENLWKDDGFADDGFDLTISCKIEDLNDEKISKFCELKQKIISSPLKRVLDAVTENDKPESTTYCNLPFVTSLGNCNGDFYAVTQGDNKDQIVILFGMNFVDQTDTILAKVFLQEFYDTRNNRLEDAPVVLYGKEPPKELKGSLITTQNSDTLNYLTIVLFPRHYGTQESRDHLLKTVPFLSDYLHYHLKCSKAYLHQRMRAKTGDFLKILNRAKPENF